MSELIEYDGQFGVGDTVAYKDHATPGTHTYLPTKAGKSGIVRRIYQQTGDFTNEWVAEVDGLAGNCLLANLERVEDADELGRAARLIDAPEPALKAALLEDAKTTEPDARTVLRDYLINDEFESVESTDAILAAVDRYVDSLPVEPTPQRRITLDDLTPRHPDQSDNEYRRMAVGELVGAATVAWDSMQHTGVFHEATASSIVDALLELFDRQLSGLPQAQVEYATEAVNPDWKAAQQAEQDAWVRRTALEQAVELVKAGVSPDMVETAAEAANKFHTFLTGSND